MWSSTQAKAFNKVNLYTSNKLTTIGPVLNLTNQQTILKAQRRPRWFIARIHIFD